MIQNLIKQIYQPTGRKVEFNGKSTVYNLGSGKQDFPGVTAVDWVDSPNVKIKHDLDVFPWPIPDNSADAILAFHYIEHTNELFKVFNEINRIGKNGCKVLIEVPHFRASSAFKDPTHKHFFTAKTIQYFCRNNHTYTDLPFKFKLVDISIGWPADNSKNPIKKWIKKWLKSHLDFYDNFLYMFLHSKILVVELEIIK